MSLVSGLDQVRLSRIGGAVLPVLAALIVAYGLAIDPRVVARTTDAEAAADAALLEELLDLQAAWQPAARARILARAPARAARLAAPLHRLLQAPNSPQLTAAVDYAGAMGVESLRPLVAGLVDTGSAEVRPRAVRAADRLAPTPPSRLVALLTSADPAVQRAALQCVVGRSDAPWRDVIALLSSEHPVVREAALATLTTAVPAEAVKALWALASGAPEEAAVALRAIHQTGNAGRYEAEILDLLPQLNPPAQLAALACLGASETPLSDASPIAALAMGEWTDVAVRASAFFCLERTRSYDVAAIRRRLPLLDPYFRYCAARCLVDAGEPAGVNELLDLADSTDPAARMGSRRLLGWLTGMSATVESSRLRTALANASSFSGRRPLQPPVAPLPVPADG